MTNPKNKITVIGWHDMIGITCKMKQSWGLYASIPEEDHLMEHLKTKIFELYGDTPSEFFYMEKQPYPNLATEILNGIVVGNLVLMDEQHARAIMNIYNDEILYKRAYCALFDDKGVHLDENC